MSLYFMLKFKNKTNTNNNIKERALTEHHQTVVIKIIVKHNHINPIDTVCWAL